MVKFTKLIRFVLKFKIDNLKLYTAISSHPLGDHPKGNNFFYTLTMALSSHPSGGHP